MLLLCALIAGSGSAWATETTDVIDNSATSSNLSSTATTTWATDFTLTGTSGASYYIHSMGTKGGSHALQWNANGYLYATKSGGTLKSVTVVGNSKSVKVYAANKAYSAKPTSGELTTLNATSTGATYTFEDDYEFIAINGSASSTQITSITIVWDDGASSSTPVDATWGVSPEEVSVKVGKKTTVDITTNYNGTLSVTSSDETIAMASYADGVLTVTGVAEGTTTLAFSGEATAKYYAINKTVNVKVVPNTVTPGTYDITPNNAFYGTDKTYSGNAAANPSSLSGEQDDITITYSKGSQSNFYVSAEQTRSYKGSTMTFEVPTGYAITAIAFTADGSYWDGTHTASVGEMTDSKNWAGVAQEVTITFGGTCRITKISVTYAAIATVSLAAACTDGTKYYGTYSNDKAFVVPADLTVSEISVIGGELLVEDYKTGDIVPANTGVMVSSATAGDHTVTLSGEAGTSVLGSDNMLKASSVAMEGNNKYYRLTMHNGETIGFWWGAEDGGTFSIAANKAYLAVPETLAREGFAFDFGGETTGVGELKNSRMEELKSYYNLNGQRVAQPTRGLYIVNGRKVVVK